MMKEKSMERKGGIYLEREKRGERARGRESERKRERRLDKVQVNKQESVLY